MTTLETLKSQEAALVAEVNDALRRLASVRAQITNVKEANRRAGDKKRFATSRAKKEAARLNKFRGGAEYTFVEGEE